MTTPPRKTARPSGRANSGAPGHETSTIKIGDGMAEVDTELVELIETMNAMQGVRTTGCCQGSRQAPGYVVLPGYVVFQGPAAVTFSMAMVSLMTKTLAVKGIQSTEGDMAPFSVEIGELFSGPCSIA
jgi:hypothetical protein